MGTNGEMGGGAVGGGMAGTSLLSLSSLPPLYCSISDEN